MIKKMMLLAVAAAAVVAFAVPATASAEWTQEGAPLGSDAEVAFSGPAGFNLEGQETGANATVHIEATLLAGTTKAEITKFEDTNCLGKGLLAGFFCTGEAQGLPWEGHIQGDDILITNMQLHTIYYADPGHTFPVSTTVLAGDILASPDNPEAISSVALEGIETTANGNPAEVSGTLAVSPAEVYGTT